MEDKVKELEKRIATLERECQGLRLMVDFLQDIAIATANKEGTCLFSYHQLYSPSANSDKELMMFINEVRKFAENPAYRNSRLSVFNVF